MHDRVEQPSASHYEVRAGEEMCGMATIQLYCDNEGETRVREERSVHELRCLLLLLLLVVVAAINTTNTTTY